MGFNTHPGRGPNGYSLLEIAGDIWTVLVTFLLIAFSLICAVMPGNQLNRD